MIMASARRRLLVTPAKAGLALFLLVVPMAVVLASSKARADVIVLRGGGQVTGKIVPDPQNKDRVLVWLLQGRKPLSLQKAQIVEVTPKASPLDEYFEKVKKATATAQAQYDLGAWCDQNKLTDLGRLHYEAALAADKLFEPAHRKLGHVFHDGYWLSRDDLSAIQGLVKYRGRWISTEEKAKRQAGEEVAANQAAWVRRIKILRQAIVNGPEDRRREAEAQLMAIREVEAVGPVLRVLGNDDEPQQRILAAHVLSRIPGKEASAAMVKQILAEPTDQVRPVIFDKLKDRDDPVVISQLVRALASSDIQVVNRAAWTLGNLGNVEVVPKLIPHLLSFEQRMVLPPPEGGNAPTYGMSGTPLAPLAYNNSNAAFLTPPVVSQGAVAYGVTTGPLYGPSLGLGTVGVPIRQPEPRLVTFTYRNVEVLAALHKMTGQDFGYDIDSWRHWVAHDFNPAPKPARRAPEP
jgi:Armadillo/beta-catenin-like repeat